MVVYPSRYVDPPERLEFWASSRAWFQERGYFLYELVDDGDKKYAYAVPTREYPDEPQLRFDKGIPEDPFPYAFMGPRDIRNHATFLGQPAYTTTESLSGRVMYAQDSKGRHVAIKMVEGDSDEYKVLRLLKDQPRLLDPESFPSVVPVLDLLPFNEHWFLVMPRWETSLTRLYFFPTFRVAFQHLIDLLEGLVFLHELRIFHRDLYARNILVNHFSSLPIAFSQSCSHRYRLQSLGVLRYAIMDFDMAMILDEKTYGSNPRRPIQEVLTGIGAAPYEVAHARPDFDAFKFDVACLGIYVSDHYQHVIKEVPLLAPLIARMVTPNIEKRFTASEALAFARTILPTISSLGQADEKMGFPRYLYYQLDVWAGLPERFVQEWNLDPYNVSSWTMRLQNWLFYDVVWGWHLTYYYRSTLRVLTCAPQFTSRSLLSLFRPLARIFGL